MFRSREYSHVQKALSHVSSKLRENLLPKEVLEEMRARVINPYESAGTSQIHNLQPSQQVSLFISRKLELNCFCLIQPKPQNTSRGDSISVSDSDQDLKMVRRGAELMKSIDYLMHTEVLKEVDEVKSFILPESLVENELTQGMKELQVSSNGDVSSLPPRSVLANNSASILLRLWK